MITWHASNKSTYFENLTKGYALSDEMRNKKFFMSAKKYSLGIVQTHATQFDGPLFKRLSRHSEIAAAGRQRCIRSGYSKLDRMREILMTVSEIIDP